MPVEQPPYELCACGSGRKYKFCCRPLDREARKRDKYYADNIIIGDLDGAQEMGDKAMRLMSRGHFEDALKYFEEAINLFPANPAGHNNLAYCRFLHGDLEQATRGQKRANAGLPLPNPFGMVQLAYFYWVAGREVEARRQLELARPHARDTASTLSIMCKVLALFKQHQDVIEVADDYPEPELETCWYAGVAAANLGDFDKALEYLGKSEKVPSLRSRARKMIRRLKRGEAPDSVEGDWPCFSFEEIVGRVYLKRMQGYLDENRLDEYPLRNSPAMVEAIVAMLNEDQKNSMEWLGLLSRFTHGRAVEVLIKIAEGTFGGDDLRLAAMRLLIERGVWKADEYRKLWINGEWQEVRQQTYGVNPDLPASSCSMLSHLEQPFEEAIELGYRGKWKKAEARWRKLRQEQPGFPPFHYNLAIAVMQQGRMDEAEECLSKVMELEPNYLFAQSLLALINMQRGKIEEARRILDDIEVPKELHPTTLASYFTAQIQVCVAESDFESALHWLYVAKSIVPGDPNVVKLSRKLHDLRILGDRMNSNAGMSRPKIRQKSRAFRRS